MKSEAGFVLLYRGVASPTTDPCQEPCCSAAAGQASPASPTAIDHAKSAIFAGCWT